MEAKLPSKFRVVLPNGEEYVTSTEQLAKEIEQLYKEKSDLEICRLQMLVLIQEQKEKIDKELETLNGYRQQFEIMEFQDKCIEETLVNLKTK